jgi:Cu-Zn family superoxide dismutase
LETEQEALMKRMTTALAALAAIAVTTVGPISLTQASGAVATHSTAATKVFPFVPSVLHNNPEGVAWDPASKHFFAGTVTNGTIYSARLTDKQLTPVPFDHPADSAVGMKVSRGKLYVAGGGTGSIYVFKIKTRKLLARFETGTGGFLNDLVVTRTGDVYVTDSFRPMIWHVSPAMVKARAGTPNSIDVRPEIAFAGGGAFNLNGIVARRGGRELIVVNTTSKALFRIKLNRHHLMGRTITKIDAPALAGDGLLIDRGRLLVVTGDPAAVHVLKLSNRDLRARQVKVLTDPSLRGPSTIARARNRYLVVNADFAGNTQPYTVTALRRGHR